MRLAFKHREFLAGVSPSEPEREIKVLPARHKTLTGIADRRFFPDKTNATYSFLEVTTLYAPWFINVECQMVSYESWCSNMRMTARSYEMWYQWEVRVSQLAEHIPTIYGVIGYLCD